MFEVKNWKDRTPSEQQAIVTGLIVFPAFFLSLGAYYWADKDNENWRVYCGLIYAAWAVLPPAWFFYEYAFRIKWDGPNLKQWERTQDLARNFWTAVLTVFAVVYVAKFGIKIF